MSGKSSPGVAGLIVEGAVIGLVVALLPKLPLGSSAAAPTSEVADQRPSLAPTRPPTRTQREELPSPPANWRTAVSRPATSLSPPPADPAYVEERLDVAGQQLVSGLATYLARHAEEVLAAPPPQMQPPTQPDRKSLQVAPAAEQPAAIAPLEPPPSFTAPRFGPPRNAFRY